MFCWRVMLGQHYFHTVLAEAGWAAWPGPGEGTKGGMRQVIPPPADLRPTTCTQGEPKDRAQGQQRIQVPSKVHGDEVELRQSRKPSLQIRLNEGTIQAVAWLRQGPSLSTQAAPRQRTGAPKGAYCKPSSHISFPKADPRFQLRHIREDKLHWERSGENY